MVEVHLVKMVWKSKSKYFEKHFFVVWFVNCVNSRLSYLNAEIDLVPFGITFIFCVWVGLDQGILIGTAINLGLLLYSNARPRIRIHKIQVFTNCNNNKNNGPKINLDISKYCSLFVAIRLQSPNILSSPRIAVWCLQLWNISCQVFARPRPSTPASSLSSVANCHWYAYVSAADFMIAYV